MIMNELTQLYEQSLHLCKVISEITLSNNLQNEQEYLNWLDNLNDISTSY